MTESMTMTQSASAVVPAEAFAELLNDAALPAILAPVVGACVFSNGQILWKAGDHLPREADVASCLIDRRIHPRMVSATLRHEGLHSVAVAMARFLALPAMDEPPPPRDPADFVIHAAATALGAQRIADAWIRGDEHAIASLAEFLGGHDGSR